MNNVIIVGRLTSDPEVNEKAEDKKVSSITVAVPRNYKNADGKYDTDFIHVTLWNAIAISTCEYCKKGDVIGIKGHLQTNSYEDDEGNKKYVTDIIGEKVSFLSTCVKNKTLDGSLSVEESE